MSAFKKDKESRGKVFGKDCIVGNIVLQMNKLRYKKGKGDPKGFVAFLDVRDKYGPSCKVREELWDFLAKNVPGYYPKGTSNAEILQAFEHF